MAAPARTARLRVLETRPNAVVHQRGPNYLIMFDPDSGKNIYETQVGSRGWHYGSNWENEVDTDWVPNGPGWEMLKAGYTASLQGNTYSFSKSGHTVSLSVTSAPEWVNDSGQREPAAQLVQTSPTASGDVITFSGLLGPGADLEIEAQSSRLAKRLTLPSLAALATPTLSGPVYFSFSLRVQKTPGLEIWVDDVLWDENSTNPRLTSSTILWRASGADIFSLPVPFAIDAAGNQASGQMYVRKTGGNLFVEVRLPQTWLQSASYPVVIDPSVDEQVGSLSDDAFADEGVTSSTATGTEVYIGCGANGTPSVRTCGFTFRTVAIPQNTTISVGYIEVVSRDDSSNPTSPPVEIYGDDVDSAGLWDAETHLLSQVVKTTAYALFSCNAARFTNTFCRLRNDSSDSVAAIVTEIVGRAGWVSGNDLRFVISGQTGFGGYDAFAVRTYDANTAYGAKLHLEYSSSSLEQEGFRWREDNGSESSATWKANQDTNSSLMYNAQARLRVIVNATGDPAAGSYRLEARKAGSSDAWEPVE